jgi:hypothetical protein
LGNFSTVRSLQLTIPERPQSLWPEQDQASCVGILEGVSPANEISSVKKTMQNKFGMKKHHLWMIPLPQAIR